MTKNFICDSNYICQGVLNLLISYLNDQSRKNLKCTCKYMFDKIKLKTLSNANHLSSELFPELDFLDLSLNKINLKLPISKALKIKNINILNLYKYNPKDIEKLCIKKIIKKYPEDIIYSGCLKELYILKIIKASDALETEIMNLEVLYIDDFINFIYYPNLKLCRCFEFVADEDCLNCFVITFNIGLDECKINNVLLFDKDSTRHICLKNSEIKNLYLFKHNSKTFNTRIILKGNILIKNIYFIDYDENIKECFIKILKPTNYKDINESDLPRFENCFGINMYK